MPKRIKKLLVDRVDLCGIPANQEANVVLFKSMSDTKEKEIVEKIQEILNTIDVSSVDSVRIAIEGLEKIGGRQMADNTEKVKELEGQVTAKDAEIATLKSELKKAQDKATEQGTEIETLKKSVKPEPEDIWKNVDPQVKAQFEEMQKTLAEATKKTEIAEITKQVSDTMARIPGNTQETAVFLHTVTKKLTKEEGAKLFELFKGANVLLEKAGLFNEAGNAGRDNTGSAGEKFMKEVDAVIAKGEIKSRAEAIDYVAKAHPDWYVEHVASVRKGGK